MPDTLPGREKPDPIWGGVWFTIERSEYQNIIRNAGGLDALTVAASATRPFGEDHVYTAWAIKGQGIPLVASDLDDCEPYESSPAAQCGGVHTFWKFIPWPLYQCAGSGCGSEERRKPPQCRASQVYCECGEVMRTQEGSHA